MNETEELSVCQQRLQQCIESKDWIGANREIKTRGQILENLASLLNNLSENSSMKSSLTERRHIRWILEDQQSTNEQLLDSMECHISSLREELDKTKVGRKALGLYRLPRNEPPRFLNRIG